MKQEPVYVAAEAAARQVALLDWAQTHEVGALWSADDGRWATEQARAEGAVDFLLARARHAVQRLGERDDRLARLLERRLWSVSWAFAAGAIGLALGLGMDRLGGQQLNLLALPLWLFLGFQLLAYTLLFALACSGRRPPMGGGALRLWQRLLTLGIRGRAGQALVHWWRLSLPLQMARCALLWHAGLLGVSLGLIAGLYLRALGLEILIGWQSTYLDAAQVQRFADVALAPAAWIAGLAVPDVGPLRHGALQAPTALAATWLHLLAATVALVALPRLLLAVHAGLRSRRLALALPLPIRSGPRDLRLRVLDPQRRLAGSLLGAAGERLSSPAGDRLLVTLADHAPTMPAAPWPARALALLGLSRDEFRAFDASVAATSLPAASPGWPAQRRQLLALAPLWAPPLQPAWQRLLEAWEAPVRERESQALQLMAQALVNLVLKPMHLPTGVDSQTQAQRTVAQQLQVLDEKLCQLYGQEAEVDGAPPAAGHWAHAVIGPRPVVRNSVLGGAIGGAATGLGADLASGGLTLGAGALVGAAVGAMAASGVTEWLNRRQGRQTASLRISLAEAGLPLIGEVLDLWLARIGLRLPLAQVQAELEASPWLEAFQGDAEQVQSQLKALLSRVCTALLRAADTAAPTELAAE